VLLDTVDDVEDLTAGFSRKIWQKITILENLEAAAGRTAPQGAKMTTDQRATAHRSD